MSSARRLLDTLHKVRGTGGRNDKLALLQKLIGKPSGDLLRQVALYAAHPHWTFGVTSGSLPVFILPMQGPLTERDMLQTLFKHLDALRERSSPRADVVKGIGALLEYMTNQEDRDLFLGIIDKDLRIGFKDWNRLFPGLLPEAELMLCEEWDGKPLTGIWQAEAKLDGIRCLITVSEKGHCEALTRSGKPLYNLTRIFEAIKFNTGLRACVLDGELDAGKFGLTSSITRSMKAHPDIEKLQFFAFDMLTLAEFKSAASGTPTRTLAKRKAHLRTVLGPAGQYLCYLPGIAVESTQAIHDQLGQKLAAGKEGLVLKDQKSSYEFARSPAWLKFKPTKDCDLKVEKAVIGKNKHSKVLGALLCRGTVKDKGKEYEVLVSVGGGYTDKQRAQFWRDRDKLIGTTVQVRYQDVTDDLCIEPGTSSLRFPRFQRLRPDKSL